LQHSFFVFIDILLKLLQQILTYFCKFSWNSDIILDCLRLTARYWTIESTLGVVERDIEVSGVDPASKRRGEISVTFGSQVS